MIKLEKFVSVAFCWCYLRHTTRTFDLPMEQKACLWIIYVTMPYASGRLLLFSFKAGGFHPSVHHLHCVKFSKFVLWLSIHAAWGFRRLRHFGDLWSADVDLRSCGSTTNRSGEHFCGWNHCVVWELISTLSSQDCPHPAPNSTELIAHSCSGLLLGLPLRKISNLGRAAGGDWHVGHDWFSGSERSERWTPKLSHEVSKAKPAHKSHWKDFLSLWKMRFWEKNLREKAFELCFKNLRSWWVLKLVRPCCSLWLQWCCTRSAWSSNVFSRRAQRQRPSNWRPLLETWWNPMP